MIEESDEHSDRNKLIYKTLRGDGKCSFHYLTQKEIQELVKLHKELNYD